MPKILLASADTELGLTMETFLGSAFEVATAPLNDRLIATLRREKPDVLIADVSAPDSGEMCILGMVRVLMPDLPIIVVSLYADELARFSQAGRPVPNALFPKPFDNDRLAQAVEQLSASHTRGLSAPPQEQR